MFSRFLYSYTLSNLESKHGISFENLAVINRVSFTYIFPCCLVCVTQIVGHTANQALRQCSAPPLPRESSLALPLTD